MINITKSTEVNNTFYSILTLSPQKTTTKKGGKLTSPPLLFIIQIFSNVSQNFSSERPVEQQTYNQHSSTHLYSQLIFKMLIYQSQYIQEIFVISSITYILIFSNFLIIFFLPKCYIVNQKTYTPHLRFKLVNLIKSIEVNHLYYSF